LEWTILNLGASGSSIYNWQAGQAYYITLQEQISGSNATTLIAEMGTNDYTTVAYATFVGLFRTFLTDIAAACPSLKEILLNCIPFDYSIGVGVANSSISAANGAIYLASLAAYQRYPFDLAGTYSQATAKAGSTGFYAATAADATLINNTDFRHPSIPAGQTAEENGIAAALRDCFVNPPVGGISRIYLGGGF
jgi:hypothetical protein